MKKLQILLILLIMSFSGGLYAQPWWSVYFTEPEKNLKGGEFSPPEDALVRLISSATVSIDGAFFEIGSRKVVSAMISSLKKGVSVRLVTDDRNNYQKALKMAIESGIPVVYDNKRGLMHNKFCIVDGRYIWTGSYNITDNCSYRNNNNAILIESPGLAAIYHDEFVEMFEKKIFENKKESRPFSTSHNPYFVRIDETNINAYFSPENDVENIIIKRLKKARNSIYFMAFSFTSDPIGETMIGKHRDGVTVQGLFEKNGSNSPDSEFNKMFVEGIPVKTDRNPHNMHHKVIIIDEEIVITGSYNFSKNASRKNDENILIIENKDIAKKYLAEFHKIY